MPQPTLTPAQVVRRLRLLMQKQLQELETAPPDLKSLSAYIAALDKLIVMEVENLSKTKKEAPQDVSKQRHELAKRLEKLCAGRWRDESTHAP